MQYKDTTGQPAGRRTASRITTARPVVGRPRTCLPARPRRTGPEAWRYPDGDDPTVVRGED